MLATIQGRKIWYTDSGSGSPAIVLLHGYLETSGVWDRFSRKLSERFRVISADLPGHGRSELMSDTQTMDEMAGIIRELVDLLKLEKVFLTGHSLGGYVTLAFLENYPEKLSGFCLFHSHPLADTAEAVSKRKNDILMAEAGKKDQIYPGAIEKMYATGNLDRLKESVSWSKSIASGVQAEGIASVLRGMMQRPSRVKLMEEGRVPCLWILGAHDNFIPFDAIQQRVKLPANGKIKVLENSGHMGFVEEEELSLEIVSEFAQSLTRNSL